MEFGESSSLIIVLVQRLSVSSHPLYRSEKVRPRMTWVMPSPILWGYRLLWMCCEIFAVNLQPNAVPLVLTGTRNLSLQCVTRSHKLVYYQKVNQFSNFPQFFYFSQFAHLLRESLCDTSMGKMPWRFIGYTFLMLEDSPGSFWPKLVHNLFTEGSQAADCSDSKVF